MVFLVFRVESSCPGGGFFWFFAKKFLLLTILAKQVIFFKRIRGKKSRLFWNYLLPHLCIILACCLCLVLLSELLLQKLYRESHLDSLQNQSGLILDDAERQLALMEDTALKIAISAEFQPSIWRQNPYYEIDLTRALKKYVGASPLNDSVLIFWNTDPDALFFASSNASGKSIFNYYAQDVLGTARDGIGWIALWKEGRGWSTETFWPDYNEKENRLAFDVDDLARIAEILKADPNAILVNSYVHNLGGMESVTREELADALRWQYDLQNARISEAIENAQKGV